MNGDAPSPALDVRRIGIRFGALHAVRDVTLALPVGARHALIGPNGAGKTTFVALITGLLVPDTGTVRLMGEDVTAMPPQERVRRGMARTFQVTSLFPEMTCLGATSLALAEREGLTGRWFRPLTAHAALCDEAASILDSLGILSLAHSTLGQLAYGQQRVMEIALALALQPRLLLLDEPAAGIPSGESARLFAVLERLPPDLTLLFIEHDMHLVRRFARQVTVLAAGAVLAEGPPEAVAADPAVQEAYLGRRHA